MLPLLLLGSHVTTVAAAALRSPRADALSRVLLDADEIINVINHNLDAAPPRPSPLAESIVTDVYLSSAHACPAGMKRAPAQAPESAHIRFNGNLNEGIASFPNQELSACGAPCARAWTLRSGSGGEFLSGCRRNAGERAWCPISEDATCTDGRIRASLTSSAAEAAETFGRFAAERAGRSDSTGVHNCKTLSATSPLAEICALPSDCGESGQLVSHADAVASCAILGARLPTLVEALSLQSSMWSALGACARPVWTLSACFVSGNSVSDAAAGRGFTTIGAHSGATTCAASVEERRLAARVCVAHPSAHVRSPARPLTLRRADEAWMSSIVSPKGPLGATILSGGLGSWMQHLVQNPPTCGFVRTHDVCTTAGEGCPRAVPWIEAYANCTNIGARLPTFEEVQRRAFVLGEPEGNHFTECNLAHKYIWTSTPCFLDSSDLGRVHAANGVMIALASFSTKSTSMTHPPHRCVDPISTNDEFGEHFVHRACAAMANATIRTPEVYETTIARGKRAVRTRTVMPLPHKRGSSSADWDWCDDGPPKIAPAGGAEVTMGGCTCAADHPCSRLPLLSQNKSQHHHTSHIANRIDGGTTFPWCYLDANASCFQNRHGANPALQSEGAVRVTPPLGGPYSSAHGSDGLPPYDACFNATEERLPKQLFVCLKREVVTADDDLVIVEVFLSQSLQCPPPFEAAQGHSDGASANINARTGGIQLLLCIRRAKRGTPGLRPIDDILVSGGNSSVLSCPCGYTAANHSKIGGHGEQHDESELPINFMELSRPFTEHKGLPWYTFLCVHRILDEVAEAKVREERAEEVRLAEDAARVRAREPVDTPQNVIAFLFLVYHGIDNEALWQRFFESAPPELRDSWVIFVHHKKSAPADGGERLTLGTWGNRMREEGRLHALPNKWLVATEYCSDSLVDAELALVRYALHEDKENRIGKFVLLSGDSIPIRSYVFIHHAMLSPTGAHSRLCTDSPENKLADHTLYEDAAKKMKALSIWLNDWYPDDPQSASFSANLVAADFAPVKASQWRHYTRDDGEWLVKNGDALLKMGSKHLRGMGEFCADEVIIPTLLRYGRFGSSRRETGAVKHMGHSQVCPRCCTMAMWWGEGHSGGSWSSSAKRTSLNLRNTDEPDECSAETNLDMRDFYGADYNGIWFQTQARPLVFRTLPRGVVRKAHATGGLFLRKVHAELAVTEAELVHMYGERGAHVESTRRRLLAEADNTGVPESSELIQAAEAFLAEFESGEAAAASSLAKANTLPPTALKVRDRFCEHGIPSTDFAVCCTKRCGNECGGAECATLDGGVENCCIGGILAQHAPHHGQVTTCAGRAAPCILDSEARMKLHSDRARIRAAQEDADSTSGGGGRTAVDEEGPTSTFQDQFEILTDLYLSDSIECPDGMELAPSQSPKSASQSESVRANLNAGVASAPPSEVSVAGCACVRTWILRDASRSADSRELVVGCHRAQGERAWCPIVGDGRLCPGLASRADEGKIRPLPRNATTDINVRPLHWDYCPDEPRYRRDDTSLRAFRRRYLYTQASCRCFTKWKAPNGNHYTGCAQAPLPRVMVEGMKQTRLVGSTSLGWCKTIGACVEHRTDQRVSVLARYGRSNKYDVCYNDDEEQRAKGLYLCLRREVHSAKHEHAIHNIMLSHSIACPAPFEGIRTGPGVSANLNAQTGGVHLLLCVQRGLVVKGAAGSSSARPIDDILLSGGNESVLSCPCGYATAPHSTVVGQTQQDGAGNELPLNLMALPRTMSKDKGRPWYNFLCVHRANDKSAHAKASASATLHRANTMMDRAASTLSRAASEPRNRSVLAFLFLVYHSIANEAAWSRFFDSAPAQLSDSWMVVVHHKKREKGEEGDALKLGAWGRRMKEEGKLVVVEESRLVSTEYCTYSLVDAELVLIASALEDDARGKKIEQLVLVSGDTLPIRSFAFVHSTAMARQGSSSLCVDVSATEAEAMRVRKSLLVAAPRLRAIGTFASKAFAAAMESETFRPTKASQWKMYGRADAKWLLGEGR